MTPLQAALALLLSRCLPPQQQEIIRRGIKGMGIPLELDELLATIETFVAPLVKEHVLRQRRGDLSLPQWLLNQERSL